MFFNQALAYEVNPQALGLPAAFNSLGDVITAILPVVISISGLALFAYLIMGGIKYITSGGDDKAIMEAKKILTNAIIGMIIVFVAFWIVRILETVLGLEITGW